MGTLGLFICFLIVNQTVVIPSASAIIFKGNEGVIRLNPSAGLQDVEQSNQLEGSGSTIKKSAPVVPQDKNFTLNTNPDVEVKIRYIGTTVKMEIKITNNIVSSITLMNLWVQVNKSDALFERINLIETKIIETQTKLSLSTFDSQESMIFHLKLIEGKTLAPSYVFNAVITWIDTDGVLAQYDPSLLPNGINDDIQIYFEYSTRVEEYQPFPVVERIFTQQKLETGQNFFVDFVITNLMNVAVESFVLNYIKIKENAFESKVGLDLVSSSIPSASVQLTSQVTPSYFNYTIKLLSALPAGGNVIVRSKWYGQNLISSIRQDFVIWNHVNNTFDDGKPFYSISSPFNPLLTPVEPIAMFDYDFDGLDNRIE